MNAISTLVVSDLHLSNLEITEPSRPHWKAYKRREFYFDEDLVRLINETKEESKGAVELVLNGDVFDFDNIVELPSDRESDVGWLAKLRGLGSEEWMSCFKISTILRDHDGLFRALGRFVREGNSVVFVIGNHDSELHWESVQSLVVAAMELDEEDRDIKVRFCHWFYVSESDTYISHGHQYDPYCVMRAPLTPRITAGGRPQIRIPFGDLCERYLLNGMGYFNPHATSNYLMTGPEYVVFFVTYMLRTQPLLVWTWFWGAIITFLMGMKHFLAPSVIDPMAVEEGVTRAATLSKVSEKQVRQLAALNVSSACANPLLVLKELWLDRALLLLGVFYFGAQVMLTVNIISPVSFWWFLLPVALLMPFYFSYSYNVHSSVFKQPLLSAKRAEVIRAVTGCKRVVFGHTHDPLHLLVSDVEFLNCGFWSPAYSEPDCKNRIGTQTFVRIFPLTSGGRQAELREWSPGASRSESYEPVVE